MLYVFVNNTFELYLGYGEKCLHMELWGKEK